MNLRRAVTLATAAALLIVAGCSPDEPDWMIDLETVDRESFIGAWPFEPDSVDLRCFERGRASYATATLGLGFGDPVLLIGTAPAGVNVRPPEGKGMNGGRLNSIVSAAEEFCETGYVETRSDRPAPPPTTPDLVDVVYCFEGTDRAISITMQNASGNSEQATDKANNQCAPMGEFQSGDFVYASAQLDGDGTITCIIKADGRVIEQASSDGEYVIASCSGSVP